MVFFFFIAGEKDGGNSMMARICKFEESDIERVESFDNLMTL